MKATTILEAMRRTRNEMERDLSFRARDAFFITVPHDRASFGCMVGKDKYALQYQKHHRQHDKFFRFIKMRLEQLEVDMNEK